MSTDDRMMTQDRTHPSAALRVAVSAPQAAAHGLNRRSACRGAARSHLATGHANVADCNRAGRL